MRTRKLILWRKSASMDFNEQDRSGAVTPPRSEMLRSAQHDSEGLSVTGPVLVVTFHYRAVVNGPRSTI